MSSFRFLSRGKLKPPPVKLKLLQSRTPSAFPDALRTTLGVIALCDIAERSKHSKSEARDIALRTKEILDVVADAVPDVTKIHPDMRTSIERFAVLLDDIRCRMEAVAITGRISRLVHLNRNECVLRSIRSQLDDAYRDFLAASTLRLEVQQAQFAVQQMNLASQQENTHLDVAATRTLAPDLSKVLLYSKLTVFLACP
ncbi:hypothetical protein B0H11DRAFT_697446 [Mycena galericulata]|nr:hypothetical protein B0H11DRAFT_697446 [Mycena galericulata]